MDNADTLISLATHDTGLKTCKTQRRKLKTGTGYPSRDDKVFLVVVVLIIDHHCLTLFYFKEERTCS